MRSESALSVVLEKRVQKAGWGDPVMRARLANAYLWSSRPSQGDPVVRVTRVGSWRRAAVRTAVAPPASAPQLAVGSEQVLAFEALDDFGARSRCADAFRLLQSLTQGLVLDETPCVLHGVDQRALIVTRRRLGLLCLNAWLGQSRLLAVDELGQRLLRVGLSLLLAPWLGIGRVTWIRQKSTIARMPPRGP